MLTIDELQLRLPQIIDGLSPGEELVITQGDRRVARLVGEAPIRKPRKAGNCKGMIVILSDDDDHLKDFAEYME
jgi:antitoxin (DNA-binding transcriptional repressor) of toxin-antitoxin stability system